MSEMTIIPDLYLEGDSKQWKNRQAIYLDIKTCEDCRKNHDKIYNFTNTVEFGVKLILILLTGTEIAKEFCILTMVWYLQVMIMRKPFMK